MKNKLTLFLCIYLATAVLALGLILPSYFSARRSVTSDVVLMQNAYAEWKEAEQAWDNVEENEAAALVFADHEQLESDDARVNLYGNMLYTFVLASIAYWIIVGGLLLFWKQKDVQAKG